MSGISGRKLKVSVDGTDFELEIYSWEVQSKKASDSNQTFGQAAAGGARDYVLAMKILQDAATASLWYKIWNAAGSDVPVVAKPYGNAVASAGQPHFSMTATITEPEGTLIGGEVPKDPSDMWNVEVEWALLGKPTRVIA